MARLERALRASRGPSIPVSSDAVGGLFSATAVTDAGAEIAAQPERALRFSAVYACVRLISEAISGLPVDVVRRKGRFREQLPDHPVAPLVSEVANPEMDSAEMWRQTIGWELTRGNGYVLSEFDARGRWSALWPIPPTRVTPARRTDGRLAYIVRLAATEYAGSLRHETDIVLDPSELLHFRAFGFGPIGLSPITQAAEAVGLALTAEEYGSRSFQQGSKPGGIITSPKKLSDEQWQRLRARWKEMHQGVRRSHLVGILEEGLGWQDAGMSNEDAQFIELRRFQVADIARIFGVPPHMIGDVERSTSWGTGIEAQGIGFVVYTLMPWITRLERVTTMRLLTSPTDRGLKIRWNVNGLLRGDFRTRMAGYALGRQWGVYSANDIAALEDLDPIPGGDTRLVPLNMGLIDADGNLVTTPAEVQARAALLAQLAAFDLPGPPREQPEQ